MTATVRRAYVDGPHGQMHLRITGTESRDRPPLVCIHMSPMSGRVFETFLAHAGRDRLALAFDTPGFGLSDAPSAPPTIGDYADALLAGLTAAGIAGPVDLMGYHTGSMIAVEMALRAPDRIRRLIMIAAPIITDEERQQFRDFYREKPATADGSHILSRWQGFYYHHARPEADVEEISERFPDALLGGRKSAWGHQAAFAHDLAGRLPLVHQPVLIWTTGDDLDVQTRRADGRALYAQRLELPGWGHGFLDLFPNDAAELVSAFLDAPDADPFGSLGPLPASSQGPRYPARVGAFRPQVGHTP